MYPLKKKKKEKVTIFLFNWKDKCQAALFLDILESLPAQRLSVVSGL